MATKESICGFYEEYDADVAQGDYPRGYNPEKSYNGIVSTKGLSFAGYKQTFAPVPLSSYDYSLQVDPFPLAKEWRPDADMPIYVLGRLSAYMATEFTD